MNFLLREHDEAVLPLVHGLALLANLEFAELHNVKGRPVAGHLHVREFTTAEVVRVT